MGPYIKATGGRFVAHSADINEMLGLGRKGKTPTEGMVRRWIQGVQVWVVARSPGDRFRLRVMCECPICRKIMPVGRLGQHAKIHP